MRVCRMLLAVVGVCWVVVAQTQDADMPLYDDAYPLLDRLDIRGRLGVAVPTDWRPYPREQVAALLARADSAALGPKEQAWLHRVRVRLDDAYAPLAAPRLKFFYTNRRDLYHVSSDSFYLAVNPILYGALGTDRATQGGADASEGQFRNVRGASVRARLFGKVGLYAELVETQARFPFIVRQQIAASTTVPGEGNWKPFKETANDYLAARGYLTYSPARWLRLKFGRDRSFVGLGNQSLFLSENAPDYLLLQLQARIWKLEYTTLFTQMVDYIRNKPDALGVFPKKYGAFHLLSYRPIPQVSVSLFESTIYGSTNANGSRGLELEYFNPLIFYRSVEQFIGSPDNSTLGLQAKANLLKRVQLYGQLVVDDYNFGNRRIGPGWWGNKVGYQLGAKWIDVLGVETLDFQAEVNSIRPYTYTHFNQATNYTHYGQALAHAQGANLVDVGLQASYQPIPALYLQLYATHTRQGLDIDGEHYGSDIFRASGPREEYNNETLQGQLSTTTLALLRVSYQLWTLPLYAEGEWTYRDSERNDVTSHTLLMGIRYNYSLRPYRF